MVIRILLFKLETVKLQRIFSSKKSDDFQESNRFLKVSKKQY